MYTNQQNKQTKEEKKPYALNFGDLYWILFGVQEVISIKIDFVSIK